MRKELSNLGVRVKGIRLARGETREVFAGNPQTRTLIERLEQGRAVYLQAHDLHRLGSITGLSHGEIARLLPGSPEHIPAGRYIKVI